MREERSDAELGSCSVATWVGDAGSFGNDSAVDEFREAVRPVFSESIIGTEVNNDTFFAANGVDGVHVGLADTCIQSG